MMEISDQTKRYLGAWSALLLIPLAIYQISSNKFSCDEWANDFKQSEQFHLILTKKENNGRDSYLFGTDLYNHESTEFYDGGGWIEENFEKFLIKDTLVKEKGKYDIIIKRKGKVIIIPFKCNGKIYTSMPKALRNLRP